MNKPGHYGVQLIMMLALLHITIPLSAGSCPEALPESYRKDCSDCPELFSEGINYFKSRNVEGAVRSWEPVILEAEKLGDYTTLACLYPKMSRMYASSSEYSTAIKYSLLFLELPEEFTSLELRSKQNGNVSEYFSILGLWEKAYEHHLYALEQAKESNDTLTMQQVFHQSGTVYYFQDSARTSMYYYQRALELALQQGDTLSLNRLYGGLASAAQKAGDLDRSLSFSRKQYDTATKPRDRAYSIQNIGDLYWSMGKRDSAFMYLEQALQDFRDLGLSFHAAKVLAHMGDLSMEMGKAADAEHYYSSSLADETFAGSPFAKSTFRGLAQIMENKGNDQARADYLNTFITLSETHQTTGAKEVIDKIRAEYLLESKESEFVQLQQAYEIKQLENFISIGSAIALLCLLIGGGFYYRALRRSHRTTKEQKEMIEEQNEQLTEYNARLKGFSSVVSHDLKQPVRTTISLAGLFKRRYHKLIPEEGREYLSLIDQQHKQMLQLIEGLQQLSTLEKPSREEYRTVNAYELVQNALYQVQSLADDKQAIIEIHPEACQWPQLVVHPAQITQVWQNLIANAIKFAPENEGVIELACKADEEGYLFSITDNGIGIAPEHHEKIFGMFSRLNPRALYEGSGIGLATCSRILENHDGAIWVESALGEGSTFYFRLPAKAGQIEELEAEILEQS